MFKGCLIGWLACSLGLALMLAGQPPPAYSADFLLKWNPNTEQDLLGYYIYYQEEASLTSGLTNATKVTLVLDTPGFDADHPGYRLTGLKDDALYYFAVSAFSTAGESALSQEVSLKKGPGDPTDPSGTDSGGGSGSGGCFIDAVWQPIHGNGSNR